MTINRREAIAFAGVTGLAGAGAARAAGAMMPVTPAAKPQWIAYPGQLAAHRFTRRMARAVARCVHIGYPGNFRQPVAQALFRIAGTADRAIPMRWAGPPARIQVTADGFGSEITARSGVLPKGASGLACRIDFSERLPCLYLDAGPLATGPGWEASLDGETWLPAECLGDDPAAFPDAPRTTVVPLSVARVVGPAGTVAGPIYRLAPGRDLILDFTDTELGALCFVASGTGRLDVQVGESIAEVRDPDPQWFEQVALAPIALTGAPQPVVLPERALRFVRFAATQDAQLSDVRFDASRWTGPVRGRFRCNDAGLNAIWDVAVATLRSNMHDFYLDGIRRDGLVWHDGPLCLPAYERVFFDATMSRQTLVAQTMPEHPDTQDSGIIDSPMYDVIAFEREWRARGDIAWSRLFRDRIVGMMRYLEGLQDASGFIDARDIRPYGFFPDWSADAKTGPDPHGAPAYGQMLLAGCFAAAARLAAGWGDATLAAQWREAFARLRREIRKAFLVPEDRLYRNGLAGKGDMDARYSSFAQAFAIASGIAGPAEYPALIAFLDDYRRRPARFSLSQVVELEAYAIAGRADRALARLRLGWLPIVGAGYRRFFEDIDATRPPDAQLAMYGRRYAASLCHAWAGAAPVMAISRGVLGVEAIEPGYARCRIAPQPSGLDWFDGTVPTPHGPIEVSWRKGRGRATIPSGVRALDGGRERVGPVTYELRG